MVETRVDVQVDTPIPLAAVAAVAGAAVVAWLVTGVAAAAPVVAVGGLTVTAAVCDARTGRIPNGLVLTGLAVVAFAWGIVAAADGRPMGELAGDLAAGALLGGAPVLFAVWLVAPGLVGGGDWKLLAVCGLALGYLAPLAAVAMVVVGFGSAIVVAAVVRRRYVVLGPLLAAGYVVAVIVTLAQPTLFGSAYR